MADILIKWDATVKKRSKAVRANQKLFGHTAKGYAYNGILDETARIGRAIVRVSSEDAARQVEAILRGLNPRRV